MHCRPWKQPWPSGGRAPSLCSNAAQSYAEDYEATILETRSIPFPVVPGFFGGKATGRCSDTGATRTSTICGAEHHGSGRHRLSNSICHGPCPNEQRELLALCGIPATARESLSV